MEGKEHIPYQNFEGERMDFVTKRLEFWQETVPKDIRRWEYELWRRRRILVHSDFFAQSQEHKTLRPLQTAAFTDDIQNEYWRQFQESFLKGHERQQRFQEILSQIELDHDYLFSRIPQGVDKEKIRMIALTGSSIYGPRRKGEYMSDIDVNFLLDQNDDLMNFDIYPTIKEKDREPYHLFGTGFTDQSRGSRDIHWLLYPHYPIKNTIPDDELRGIIDQLAVDTQLRKPDIEAEIQRLNILIENEAKENPRGWQK